MLIEGEIECFICRVEVRRDEILCGRGAGLVLWCGIERFIHLSRIGFGGIILMPIRFDDRAFGGVRGCRLLFSLAWRASAATALTATRWAVLGGAGTVTLTIRGGLFLLGDVSVSFPGRRRFARRCQVSLEVVGANQVLDMQERSALLANVDERRLHAGQNPTHRSQTNVAKDAAVTETLDVELSNDARLDESDADLTNIYVDNEQISAHVFIFCHWPLVAVATPRARCEHRRRASSTRVGSLCGLREAVP